MRRGLITCLGPQAMREVPAEDIALDVQSLYAARLNDVSRSAGDA